MVSEYEELMIKLTQRLTDEGKLIEAGWISLRKMWLPHDTPASQVAALRMAFMAGAQHLFASVNTIMGGSDDDVEPTEADLRRMDMINGELNAFYRELQLSFSKPAGSG